MTGGRTGIVDATAAEAARSGREGRKDGTAVRDPEAGPHVGKDGRGRMRGIYGHPIRTGVDGDGFVRRRTVVPGNGRDGRERDRLLSDNGTANTTFHGPAVVAPDIRKSAVFPRPHGLPRPAAGG